jgi:LmbE family N-acetylglucosaminyl deacetylase
MRILCIFAHPDDESAGIGGTIALLTQAGHEVHIISATDGNAGECMEKAQDNLKQHNNHLGSLRREEFSRACNILGATSQVLAFTDGGITNQDVWGALTLEFISQIDAYKPDILITFDHTGWYYHLDHVGVSIAVTLAAQQCQHRNFAFLLSHVKMSSTKWRYCFPDVLPTTHSVSIDTVKERKLAAIEAHTSQDLDVMKQHLHQENVPPELFQLITCKNDEAQAIIKSNALFTSMG